jgi:hypothetical protein
MPSIKKRIEREHDAWADGHRDTIAEFGDWKEPDWWAGRVERLYRDTVIPRLEAKQAAGHRLDRVEERVLSKARAYLAVIAKDNRP